VTVISWCGVGWSMMMMMMTKAVPLTHLLNTEDRELGRVVDGLVGRVNGRFGYADYCPVNYVKRGLKVREISKRPWKRLTTL